MSKILVMSQSILRENYLERPPTPFYISQLLRLYGTDKTAKKKVLIICVGRKNGLYKSNPKALTLDYRFSFDPHILADIEHRNFSGAFEDFKIRYGGFDLVIASYCENLTPVALGNLSYLLKSNGFLILGRDVEDNHLNFVRTLRSDKFEGVKVRNGVGPIFVYMKTGIAIPHREEVISKRIPTEMARENLESEVNPAAVGVILGFVDFKDFKLWKRLKILRDIKDVRNLKKCTFIHCEKLNQDQQLQEMKDLVAEAEEENKKYEFGPLKSAKDFLHHLEVAAFERKFPAFYKELESFTERYSEWPESGMEMSKEDRKLAYSFIDSLEELKKLHDSLDQERKKHLERDWAIFQGNIDGLKIGFRHEELIKAIQLRKERKRQSKELLPIVSKFERSSIRGIDLTRYPRTKEIRLGLPGDTKLVEYFSKVNRDICISTKVLSLSEDREKNDWYRDMTLRNERELFFTEIEKCRHRFLIVDLTLHYKSDSGHANLLFIDIPGQKISRFEPNGSGYTESEFADEEMHEILADIRLTRFFYLPPLLVCPYIGMQVKQKKTKAEGEEKGGYCASYAFLVMELKILNPDLELKEIQHLLKEQSKKEILIMVQKYTERIREIYFSLTKLEEELAKHFKLYLFYLESLKKEYGVQVAMEIPKREAEKLSRIVDVPAVIMAFIYEPPKDYFTGALVKI